MDELAGSFSGGIHACLAVFCLILGPIVLRRRKGGSAHKLWGRIWAGSMLVMNISALMTYDMSGKPNLFHAFALLNLAALLPAIFFVWRYGNSRKRQHLVMHQEFMVWAYFGLAAAGVWQVVTMLLRHRWLDLSYGAGINGLGALTFLSGGALSIFMRKRRKTLEQA